MSTNQVLSALSRVLESHVATSNKPPFVGAAVTESTLHVITRDDGVEQRFRVTVEEITEGPTMPKSEEAAPAG